jgi:hypothetical protein
MSFIRCGVSTTVRVCAAGDGLAVFDTVDVFVFVGVEHAEINIAIKRNANDLMKQSPLE